MSIGMIDQILSKLADTSIFYGQWTPQVYDLNTLIRSLPKMHYWRIGDLYFGFIYLSSIGSYFNGINTMLQIRNTPWKWTIGGSIYMPVAGDGANHTIQASPSGVYFRPNIKSSNITSTSTAVSILLVGTSSFT